MTDYAELIERLESVGPHEIADDISVHYKLIDDTALALTTLSERVAELEAHNALLVRAVEPIAKRAKDGAFLSEVEAGAGRKDRDWHIIVTMGDISSADRISNATPEKILAAAEVLELAVKWRNAETGTAEFSQAVRRLREGE